MFVVLKISKCSELTRRSSRFFLLWMCVFYSSGKYKELAICSPLSLLFEEQSNHFWHAEFIIFSMSHPKGYFTLKVRGIFYKTTCASACCEININHKVRLDSCMLRLRMHLFFRTLGKLLGHALWNKSAAQKCWRHFFRKVCRCPACIILHHDAWGCILGRSCLAAFPYTKHIFIHHI